MVNKRDITSVYTELAPWQDKYIFKKEVIIKMQGFAHALMPIILENEVWLSHTPNPRTCWTFFDLQSSLFPSPISFLSSSFLLHPRNSKIFSSLQLWEYLYPPQVFSKEKKDFPFMTIYLFWGFAITHTGGKTHSLVCPSFRLPFILLLTHSQFSKWG